MYETRVCPECGGYGTVAPDQDGYDGCRRCNAGDGPTGRVAAAGKPPETPQHTIHPLDAYARYCQERSVR